MCEDLNIPELVQEVEAQWELQGTLGDGGGTEESLPCARVSMNLLGRAKAILVPDLFIAQSQWRWRSTVVPFISENSS